LTNFLAKAIRHLLGAFFKLADGFTGAPAQLRQLIAPKNQESYYYYDHNMDGLDSEWHLKFLSLINKEWFAWKS
jgi:hypothetical protein